MHICADAHNGHVLLHQCEFTRECDVYIQGARAVSRNNPTYVHRNTFAIFDLLLKRSDMVFPECLSLSHVLEACSVASVID